MLALLKKTLPKPMIHAARRVRHQFKYGGKERLCPICSTYSSHFKTVLFNNVYLEDVECAFCGSHERHRLSWMFFKSREHLLSGVPGRRMLHVAPEHYLRATFRKAFGEGYLTADFLEPDVDVKMDIVSIQYPDQTFDAIYCSQVLQYVSDDQKALNELYRVLKVGGWAIILVPMLSDKLHDDLSRTDPLEMHYLSQQTSLIRRYRPDQYSAMLLKAGFKLERVSPSDIVSPEKIVQLGLKNETTGQVYFCTR